MRLAPPPLEIGDRDGFEGTDIFGYQQFGTRLASLVESLEGPSVIALDGDWGSGKTVFAKQWAGLLRTRGTAVVYFDAFSADTGDDPLFDIASQLFAAAEDSEPRKAFGRATVVLVTELTSIAASAGLSAVSGGLIGPEFVRSLKSVVSDAGPDQPNDMDHAPEAFRRRLEGATDRTAALVTFREELTALAANMRAAALRDMNQGNETERARPVVMIVDELDRCTPSYALHLLENLKHVFDVENMCFLLITNYDHMAQTIEGRYGGECSRKYLEKFFPLLVRLPTELPRNGQDIKKEYLKYLVGYMMGRDYVGWDTLLTLVARIATSRDWSLRIVERFVRNMEVCASTGIDVIQNEVTCAIACSLHADDPDLYCKLRSGQITQDEVNDYLGIRMDHEDDDGSRVQSVVGACFRLERGMSHPDGRAYPDGVVRYLCDVLDCLGLRTT